MIKEFNINKNKIIKLFIFFLVLCSITFPATKKNNSNKVLAASISDSSDMVTRNQVSVPSDHTITFITPTGITGYSENIAITFPVAFNFTGIDYTDIDLLVSANPGECSSFSDRTLGITQGTDWGSSISSNVINLYGPTTGDIASTGVPAGHCVQVKVGKNASGGVDQIVNPSSPSNQAIMLEVANTDIGVTYVTITNDDQVDISATVDAILAFSISDTAIGFGTFVANTVSWATYDGNPPHTDPGTGSGPVTISSHTNANQGYTISLRSTGTGSNAGMYNPIASKLIPTTNAASVTSGEAYAAYTGNVTGDIVMASGFSGPSSNTAMTTSDQTIASASQPISPNSFDLYLKAIISGATPAGLYTDTLVLTCTAVF